VGVLYLDSRQMGMRLTVADRELLQTLALEASNVIENARLLEDERRNRKIQEELEIARNIQQSLLPRRLPETGWFRAAGMSIPSQNVAGDYFDVRQTEQGRFVNIIVDVSGKGAHRGREVRHDVLLHPRRERAVALDQLRALLGNPREARPEVRFAASHQSSAGHDAGRGV
jgi:serine phosphatase RsbU (regulator of sigma subunit)